MENKGKQTKQDKQKSKELGPVDPYEKLAPHKQMAVYLRIRLVTHETISKMINKGLRIKCRPITVRTWFMKGGECYEAYQKQLAIYEEETKKSMEGVDRRIKSGIPIALNTLINRSEGGSIMASEYLMKIGGYEVDRYEDVTKRGEYLDRLEIIINKIKHRGAKKRTGTGKSAAK